MNFLNFYTLIFKKQLDHRKFVFYYFFLILFFILLTVSLHFLDFNLNENDYLKKYQLNKIQSKNFQDIDTIFVGDSSCGNAIDSQYFNTLSKLKSLNLCLTASWGLFGSLGMIKKSIEANSKIKNIIIIQTLDIWSRDLSKNSILELFEFTEQYKILNLETIIGYIINPKEPLWHIKYLYNNLVLNRKTRGVEIKHDYLKQESKTFSSQTKTLKIDETLNNLRISKGKAIELTQLDLFCKEHDLNCILLNGPIHEVLLKNSKEFISYLNEYLFTNITYIKYNPKILSFENYKMGDSEDHVDVKFKKESTLKYYNLLKSILISRRGH